MNVLRELAVIIPVAPGDTAWTALVADLKSLPLESEILFVGPELPSQSLQHLLDELRDSHGRVTGTPLSGVTGSWEGSCRKVRWLQAPKGRGHQLNAGVKATQKPFLWFLHADCRFTQAELQALKVSLERQFDALHYFDLAFLNDGPALTAVNTVGVWFRSHLLGLPFGDQGFCLARQLFERLSGFREDVPYGEDHLLVWQARTQAIDLRCTGGVIQTSARKYQQQGWWATTRNHLILTAKQAFPEWLKFLKARALNGLPQFDHLGWNFLPALSQVPKRGEK